MSLILQDILKTLEGLVTLIWVLRDVRDGNFLVNNDRAFGSLDLLTFYCLQMVLVLVSAADGFRLTGFRLTWLLEQTCHEALCLRPNA